MPYTCMRIESNTVHHIHIHTCVCAYICVYTYICAHIYVMYKCTCAYMHSCMFTRRYIYTQTHTHNIYTYELSLLTAPY